MHIGSEGCPACKQHREDMDNELKEKLELAKGMFLDFAKFSAKAGIYPVLTIAAIEAGPHINSLGVFLNSSMRPELADELVTALKSDPKEAMKIVSKILEDVKNERF